MCGLAGMIGRGSTVNIREAYKELLYVSALRGREGTGVMAVNTRAQPTTLRLFKSTGEANDFLRTYGDRKGFLSSGMYDVLMGHCRWPTMGKVSHANVHPFDVGNLIGAHNGTLESSKFRDRNKTDSEMMFRLMNEKGILPVLGGMRAWDAYAVSIFDKRSNKLYLARNDRRPLAVAICKYHDIMFWASEYLMLHMVMKRNNIEAEVYTLSKNRLYEIDVEDIKAGEEAPWSTDEIEVPKRTKEDDLYEAWTRGEISASQYAAGFDDKIPF